MIKIIFQACDIQDEQEVINFTKKNISFFKTQKIPYTLPKKFGVNNITTKAKSKFVSSLRHKWIKEENGFLEKVTLFLI